MIIKKVFKLTLSLFILALAGLLGLQVYVHFSTKAQIYSDSIQVPESDYIMVLGCGVLENRPTPMLQNRLDAGLELYQRNKGAKIILSGHKDGDYYDEVSVMKNYLLEKGVPEEDLIEDKAGTNTYYSIRNFDRYQDESLIVVTQKKAPRTGALFSQYAGPKRGLRLRGNGMRFQIPHHVYECPGGLCQGQSRHGCLRPPHRIRISPICFCSPYNLQARCKSSSLSPGFAVFLLPNLRRIGRP